MGCLNELFMNLKIYYGFNFILPDLLVLRCRFLFLLLFRPGCIRSCILFLVDECFTYDSFITKHEPKNRDIKEMISIIGNMIQEIGLENLMYEKISEYRNMTIESIHVPEDYYFKYDETMEIL